LAQEEVLSVREAAGELQVSPQRVRRLIHDQLLPARKTSAGWLVGADAVRARAGHEPKGRPVAAVTAWAVLSTLADPQATVERRLRYRARQLISALPAPSEDPRLWAAKLGRRSQNRRFWAHPGTVAALEADTRVSHSGADLIRDAALSPARRDAEVYLRQADLPALIAQYRLRPDPAGTVVIHVIPDAVPAELGPLHGEPVPVLVAATDLLDDDDPRLRAVAVRELGAAWTGYLRGQAPS
jgi:hypothetical protein